MTDQRQVTVHCQVQRALVLAYLEGDPGDWFFVLCRRGLSEALGTKLKTNERFSMQLVLNKLETKEAD